MVKATVLPVIAEMLARPVCSKIDWKEGKDLTSRVETKKQRNKSRFLIWVGLFLFTLGTRHWSDPHHQEGGAQRIFLYLL